MPFVYQLDRDDADAPAGAGRATLVVCNLGERRAANRALEIATKLADVSGKSVLLLSELPHRTADDGALRLKSAIINRFVAYDVLIAIDRNERARLSPRMISIISTLKVRSVKRINPRGKTTVYRRPPHEDAKRALFIFPGVFVPPRIGSHQRAFSTVLDLIENGFEVDVVVKRNGGRLIDRVKHYFALFTSRLETYLIDEPGGQPAANADAAETAPKPRAPHGHSFRNRLEADINRDGAGLVAGMLKETRYDVIVVSFPWMLHILDGVELNGAKLVCDTHDVISNRFRELGAQDETAGEDEARLEREILSRCDSVLAISRSDAKLFKSRLGLERVVVHPISYYPSEPTIHWRRVSKPLVFGFLGSDMEANRRALRHVMTEWWPVIEEFSPESQIIIGGAIALSESLSPFVVLRDRVTVAGPLDDIGAFFGSIDVLLSPSLVQGGVNVKNVEALLRRRPVITNALGAEVLAPLSVPTQCETPEQLLELLKRIDQGEPKLQAAVEKLFEDAARYHAKSNILEWA